MLNQQKTAATTSVVLLAGGNSKRFGQDKALLQLAGKPIIRHVLDNIEQLTKDTIVVASTQVQIDQYSSILPATVKIMKDSLDVQSPLAGAMTGFRHAAGEYTLLLACDTPFISREALMFLLDLCIGKDIAIPRWPNGYLEPLHAAYKTKSAYNAARTALYQEKLNMRSMLENLQKIHYVSIDLLQRIDQKLLTFYNINNLNDLKKACEIF